MFESQPLQLAVDAFSNIRKVLIPDQAQEEVIQYNLLSRTHLMVMERGEKLHGCWDALRHDLIIWAGDAEALLDRVAVELGRLEGRPFSGHDEVVRAPLLRGVDGRRPCALRLHDCSASTGARIFSGAAAHQG